MIWKWDLKDGRVERIKAERKGCVGEAGFEGSSAVVQVLTGFSKRQREKISEKATKEGREKIKSK